MQSAVMTRAARREQIRALNEPPLLTVGEEVFNVVSHGVGALLAVAAMRQFEEGNLADFTAGTLKVSFDNDRSAPVQMAMRLIAPWCADPFAFRGVTV